MGIGISEFEKLDGNNDKKLSHLEKAELKLLELIRDKGGLTTHEALKSGIHFGGPVDAIDVINKYSKLGVLKLNRKTGKHIYAL